MRAPGRLAQLVEHIVYTDGVGGSSPSPPTSLRPLAQATARQANNGEGCRAEARSAKAGSVHPRARVWCTPSESCSESPSCAEEITNGVNYGDRTGYQQANRSGSPLAEGGIST